MSFAALACFVLAFCGCDEGGENNTLWPDANISGVWSGTFTESGGSETAISFTFMQNGPEVLGTATYLGRFTGTFHGRTLNITGTDLVGYLEDNFAIIRGTFTASSGKIAIFSITKEDGIAIPVSAPSGGSSGSQSVNNGGTGSGDDSGWDGTWPPPEWGDWTPTPPPMP